MPSIVNQKSINPHHSISPSASQKGVNLCDALLASASLLCDVRSGLSMTEALTKVAPECRPAAQSLSFTALRNAPTLLYAISQFAHKALDSNVEDLLLVASSTLLPNSPNTYAPHTLVNETVKAAGTNVKTQFAKGLINAVMRRLIEFPEHMKVAPKQTIDFYPSWWIRRLKKYYPNEWQALLELYRLPANLYLRVNPKLFSREAYIHEMDSNEIGHLEIPENFQALAPQAIALKSSVPVTSLPHFSDGAVSIQDLGAQRVAHIVKPRAGERILDACAAPGGKTTHLLELAVSDLTVLEIDPQRMLRVQENLTRHSLSATTIIGDASDVASWWDGKLFDTILADVPCSATGIIRRHPDILYLRREEDFKYLRIAQRKILSSLWTTLKPGGRFIYVTCSIFPDEGEEQCRWFLREHQDALRLESVGQTLPTMWSDGFFYGIFQKVL